jgi:Putative polyhydroxyalkanoic acid system protein (PHA_gran_rgn)
MNRAADTMRLSISHNKPKEDVKKAVDRSFEDLFRGSSAVPLQVVNQRRSWQGDMLSFSCTAKIGILSTGIHGTVEVTDKDLTIDADLGLLEKLLSAKGVQSSLASNIRGLLK